MKNYQKRREIVVLMRGGCVIAIVKVSVTKYVMSNYVIGGSKSE